jgi:hypothetical protein
MSATPCRRLPRAAWRHGVTREDKRDLWRMLRLMPTMANRFAESGPRAPLSATGTEAGECGNRTGAEAVGLTSGGPLGFPQEIPLHLS